jgi:hypothetical protein
MSTAEEFQLAVRSHLKAIAPHVEILSLQDCLILRNERREYSHVGHLLPVSGRVWFDTTRLTVVMHDHVERYISFADEDILDQLVELVQRYIS